MRSILSKTGKLTGGILLFILGLGLGLVYTGCTYMNSAANGIFKKIDTLIYIICFMPAAYGVSLVLDALGIKQSQKTTVHSGKDGSNDE